jgi:S1-C subfamily serine protease
VRDTTFGQGRPPRRASAGIGTIVAVSVFSAVLASAATTMVLDGPLGGSNAASASPGPSSAVLAATSTPKSSARASATRQASSAAPSANDTSAAGPTDTEAQVAGRVIPSVVLVDNGEGFGSGFIASADGWIVTNHHVVADNPTVTVRYADGRETKGRVRGVDPLTDLALIRVTERNLPPLEIGVSADLQVGQHVIAVGNPEGFTNTVTSGIVSAVGRSEFSDLEDQGQYRNLIQTDASINHGNSGGPLVDLNARVVGINTLGFGPEFGDEGLGFAIPSDVIRPIVQQATSGKPLTRPFLGVRYVSVDAGVAEREKLTVDHGVLLTKRPDPSGTVRPAITPGSPAARAGLKDGDVIVGIGDINIDDHHPLENVLVQFDAGSTVVVHIVRDGQPTDVNVTLGQRAPAEP